MRKAKVHENSVQNVKTEQLSSYRGVKRQSRIFNLIDNQPLTAPVDVMHQVCMGVGKILMQALCTRTAR